MRYSFTLRTLVQYFVVLGNSIFLHFPPISNKLKKVVSLRYLTKLLVCKGFLYYKNELQVLESFTSHKRVCVELTSSKLSMCPSYYERKMFISLSITALT
ncbi:hypothetical protein T03_15764, partial [Trichinella britovi]